MEEMLENPVPMVSVLMGKILRQKELDSDNYPKTTIEKKYLNIANNIDAFMYSDDMRYFIAIPKLNIQKWFDTTSINFNIDIFPAFIYYHLTNKGNINNFNAEKIDGKAFYVYRLFIFLTRVNGIDDIDETKLLKNCRGYLNHFGIRFGLTPENLFNEIMDLIFEKNPNVNIENKISNKISNKNSNKSKALKIASAASDFLSEYDSGDPFNYLANFIESRNYPKEIGMDSDELFSAIRKRVTSVGSNIFNNS